jgi:predicted dehydrogenase
VIAILGSGFGLYGYLPALVGGCGQRIVLSERYRARFCERPELARFAGDVQWERDEATALDCADGVVLALRPSDQSAWIPRCLARANIERLLLEKPLASSPEVAAALFGELTRSRKVIRMGYTFRYTAWGKRILDALGRTRESRTLSIQWNFLSHHFRDDLHNWKRFHVSGGGAIRFYGIQLIALLAEIGYRDVIVSRSFGKSVDEIEKWTASFAGPGLPECDIVVDTRAAVGTFRVELLSNSSTALGAVVANLSDPFDSTGEACQSGGLDRRVSILSRLCRSLWEQSINEYVWYQSTIELWRCIEEKTQFEMIGSR